MNPREMLEAFDLYLAERALRLEAVIIGGAALNLLGVISRATKDCDILHPPLPAAITDAGRAFAAEVRKTGGTLGDDWLNNGPSSRAPHLPPGWQERLQPAFCGVAIELRSLGREDLLRSKLFALCDRGIDLRDCMALSPTAEELHALLPWLEQQDANPDWPVHVRETISNLDARLRHGL